MEEDKLSERSFLEDLAKKLEIEDGIEEYHFGDEQITGDRTSANSSMTGLTSEKEIIYPSRNS